jgi:hypothetical protein
MQQIANLRYEVRVVRPADSAQRRRRFRTELAFGQTSQSSVALRLPPHSKSAPTQFGFARDGGPR